MVICLLSLFPQKLLHSFLLEPKHRKKKYYHIPDATTEQMGYGSISFFVCFPLMNQIVITYPFCQIKKVAEFLPFFAAILYILYGRNFTPMFNK